MKSCFLFGHRDSPYDIQSAIEAAVEWQYLNHGIRQYYVGGYGSFDGMAASAVKRVKKRYQDISLYLLLPYHPAERPWKHPKDLTAPSIRRWKKYQGVMPSSEQTATWLKPVIASFVM